jgi:hypothetical protein
MRRDRKHKNRQRQKDKNITTTQNIPRPHLGNAMYLLQNSNIEDIFCKKA